MSTRDGVQYGDCHLGWLTARSNPGHPAGGSLRNAGQGAIV